MDCNDQLFNAAEVAENPETAFIVEGSLLHAVEKSVADLQKEKSSPELVLPLMRDALQEFIKYADGKVEPHFLLIDFKEFEGQREEQEKLIHAIHNIYSHLPHHNRNELTTLIHHREKECRGN